jgi:hypothetical protein
MYHDIAPYDPEGVLQHEFLNSRGAIARFDRNTIEIRVLDIQECPGADLGVLTAIVEVLKALVGERWSSKDRQQAWACEPLVEIYKAAVVDGEAALITNRSYLEMFGLTGTGRCRAGDLWRHLADSVLGAMEDPEREALRVILAEGTLARRMVNRLGEASTRDQMAGVYRELCDCLAEGRMFHGSSQ